MNCAGFSGNILRKYVGQLLQVNHGVVAQQTRNTFILKRRHPPPLYRKGSKPPSLKRRHYIYDLVKNTDNSKRPALSLILTTYVDGLGNRGEKVSVAPFKAYNKLLLPGLAVYDTPENSQKYTVLEKNNPTENTSPFVPRTINVLKHMILSIIMSNDTPWTLEPWHVRSAFRKALVHLNEDCITMPNHTITGPNHDIENREFYVIITVNGKEKTPVRCRIHHHSNDVHDRKLIPVVVNFWKEMSEPLFPEDKPVLDSLPIPFLVQRERQNQTVDYDEPL
ncbi:39S ribosomal protein L9, mitochondrial [Fopius arisanus]|uniref:Large ribosomal subunit protein bL9m n=1 Tax=Fopius arisanus TaxID=64838 RepID=A0A0C9PSK5_9HYME|nr:PREDICTED: 39S ribosomal protein L9, mitochondrial [Fopius arisanus]